MFTTVKVVRLDSMGRESVEIIEGDLPTVAARVLADDPHGVIELKLV